jgi:hypothetical protein
MLNENSSGLTMLQYQLQYLHKLTSNLYFLFLKAENNPIKLLPPNAHFKLKSEDDASTVTINGIHHCSLLGGITRAFIHKSFFDLHFKGFQLWWKAFEGKEPQRIFGEVYILDTFLEMEEEISVLSEQDIQNGVQESVVTPIMLYSDATHLVNFGTASLWPVIIICPIQAILIRCIPSCLYRISMSTITSSIQMQLTF